MIQFRSKPKSDLPRRRQSGDFVRTPAAPIEGQQFRRNQTLSSIHHGDTEALSDRGRMHHLARRRRNIGGVFALVIGIIAILAGLLSQFTAQAVVAGSSAALTQSIKPTEYEKAINQYFGIHPVERLRFAMNESALSDYVAGQLSEVAAVKLSSVDNLVEANFTITFRKPIAGWQINGHQYYVDTTGVVFENNYYDTPGVQIVDQSGVSPEQGSIVASARLLSFVGRIVALAGQGSYDVTSVVLPSGTTRELEVHIKDVQPFVKLSIDRGAGEQVEDMIRSIKYLQAGNKTSQYIDVRVSGRAVYL